MSDQYPKGHGALFINNEKKQPNHPDFRGNVELTTEQIRKLIEMAKAGLEPKLQLAGWNKVAKSGLQFISMETEAYMKAEEQNYPPQQTGIPQPQIPVPQQQVPQQAPAFEDEDFTF